MRAAIGRSVGVASRIKLSGPAAQFLCTGIVGLFAILLLGQVVVGRVLSVGVLAGAGFYVGAIALALVGLIRTYPHRAIGLCNVVTVARLMLVGVLVSALVAPVDLSWSLFAVGLVAFALDGVDGWLARREGFTSRFGARFDMEVDSALAIVLAILAFQSGNAGTFVIILGLPRYVFLVAQVPFPWLAGDLPDRFSRKVVCVLQITVLLVAIMPAVNALVANLLTGMVSLALIWSFAKDVYTLWMTRA